MSKNKLIYAVGQKKLYNISEREIYYFPFNFKPNEEEKMKKDLEVLTLESYIDKKINVKEATEDDEDAIGTVIGVSDDGEGLEVNFDFDKENNYIVSETDIISIVDETEDETEELEEEELEGETEQELEIEELEEEVVGVENDLGKELSKVESKDEMKKIIKAFSVESGIKIPLYIYKSVEAMKKFILENSSDKPETKKPEVKKDKTKKSDAKKPESIDKPETKKPEVKKDKKISKVDMVVAMVKSGMTDKVEIDKKINEINPDIPLGSCDSVIYQILYHAKKFGII